MGSTKQQIINTEHFSNYRSKTSELTAYSSREIEEGSWFERPDEANSNITLPFSWSVYRTGLEQFSRRLDDCKYMSWASLVCENCGDVVKKNAVRLSCLSAYCQNPHCIENRKRIIKNYLQRLNITSKNLIHLIFGFSKVKHFTVEERKKHLIVLRLFEKVMEKLGTPLKMVTVRDLAGRKEDLFIHYHGSQLPVKDYRKFHQNINIARERVSARLKIDFTIRSKHYRGKRGLFKYFSHRGAGVFGNIKNYETYGFPELMDLKEYYDTLYNTRKVNLYGLQPNPKGSNVPLLIDNFLSECPFCHSKHIKLIPNELIFKPPPCKCKECGLEVLPRDFCFELSSCKWCKKRGSPEFKMSKIREKFNNYLHARHKSMLKISEKDLGITTLK